jgi:hypothetical protein
MMGREYTPRLPLPLAEGKEMEEESIHSTSTLRETTTAVYSCVKLLVFPKHAMLLLEHVSLRRQGSRCPVCFRLCGPSCVYIPHCRLKSAQGRCAPLCPTDLSTVQFCGGPASSRPPNLPGPTGRLSISTKAAPLPPLSNSVEQHKNCILILQVLYNNGTENVETEKQPAETEKQYTFWGSLTEL